MKDQKSVIKIVEAVAPVTGKATAAAIAIDRQGFEFLTIVADLGAGAYTASAFYTPTLTHSDDGTNYEAVDADQILGELSTVKATIAANQLTKIGYIGEKRYVKFAFVVTGTLAADVSVAAFGILGHPHLSPVA